MSWEYRVIEKDDGSLGRSYEIHEVYYDEDNKIEKWSTDSIKPYGGDIIDLRGDLENMHRALQLPVIKESELKVGANRTDSELSDLESELELDIDDIKPEALQRIYVNGIKFRRLL